MSVRVYCDEHGFTGPDLLSKDQPFFAYAGVVVPSGKEDELLAEIRKQSGSKAAEIKAKNLLGDERGSRAISNLLVDPRIDFQCVVADKMYALCGKAFEFLIEPTIKQHNWLAYRSGFHKYVAAELWSAARGGCTRTHAFLLQFSNAVKIPTDSNIDSMLLIDSSEPSIIHAIKLIAKGAIGDIRDEFGPTGPAARLSIDLTLTCLAQVLAYLGSRHERLEVICDRSKPLAAQKELVQAISQATAAVRAMRGREMVPVLSGFGFTFVDNGDSLNLAGLQLADLVAGGIGKLFMANGRSIGRSEVSQQLCDRVISKAVGSLIEVDDEADLRAKAAIFAPVLAQMSKHAGKPTYLNAAKESLLVAVESADGDDGFSLLDLRQP